MPPAVKTAREGLGRNLMMRPMQRVKGKNQGSLVGLDDLHHWSGGLLPNPATRVSFSVRSLCCLPRPSSLRTASQLTRPKGGPSG